MPHLAHASWLALALALGQVAAAQQVAVPDLDGVTRTPLAVAPGETHALIFVALDCPISNRYAPEVGRLAADYAPKRVRVFLIYADRSVTSAGAREHLDTFHPGLRAAAIVDTEFRVTKAVGATVTPEAAVYTTAGRAYRGRIDDLYVSLGETRHAPTRRDLRLSLDALLAGRKVPVAETRAVGCYIARE
jgi:hypothetical protein